MKSPDEIKKGLECCNQFRSGGHWNICSKCPCDIGKGRCDGTLETDALTYIVQLEADNAQQARCIENLTDKLNATNDALPRWISVEERLPEDEKDVAVIVKMPKGNWMYLTAFRLPMGGWWINRGSGLDYAEVTHWSPLPPSSPFGGSADLHPYTGLVDGGSGTT